MYHKPEHRIINGVEYKWCYQCSTPKILSDFHKQSPTWDGLAPLCKTCKQKTNARWRAAHPNYDTEYHRRVRGKC